MPINIDDDLFSAAEQRRIPDDLAQVRDQTVTFMAEEYIRTATNVQVSELSLADRARFISHIQMYSWSGGYCDADRCIHVHISEDSHCTSCTIKIEEQNAEMNQSIRIEVSCPRCYTIHFDVEPSQLNELICLTCNQSIRQTMDVLHEQRNRMKAHEEKNNV